MPRVFLPFVPNWANGIRDTYEFLTDVFTSRNGSEQRRSQRIQPRRSMTVAVLLDGDRGRQFQDAVNRARTGEIDVPDYSATRAEIMAVTAVPGATILVLDHLPDWLEVGTPIAVAKRDRWSVRAAPVTISGTTVTFLTSMPNAAPGDIVQPLLPALFAPSNTLQQAAGPDIQTTSLTVEIEPGTPARTPVDLDDGIYGPAAIFYGRYVLMRKPNLMQQPTLTFGLPFERVDYGRGIAKKFAPVPITSRTITASWMGRRRADVMALLDVFLRCKGRAGEVYLPTWGSDFPPILVRSGRTLTFGGTEFLETYGTDEAHRSVLFSLQDGGTVPREIESIYEFQGNTVVRFDEAPPALANIERISWMFVARFAQDSLTIEWITDEVANVAMSFVTLRNLPVEDAFGSNWILATGYWRDLGQWVDTDVWRDG